MDPLNYIVKYLPAARETEAKTGFSAVANLTQGAVEGGWGDHCPGNNFFGVKDSDGINGNEQLLVTTEYSKYKTLKFPVILSIVWSANLKLWKYTVKDFFRKYNDASEVFQSHADFFRLRPRYAKAWAVRGDYKNFFTEIAKAGYATDPNYSQKLINVGEKIETLIITNKL